MIRSYPERAFYVQVGGVAASVNASRQVGTYPLNLRQASCTQRVAAVIKPTAGTRRTSSLASSPRHPKPCGLANRSIIPPRGESAALPFAVGVLDDESQNWLPAARNLVYGVLCRGSRHGLGEVHESRYRGARAGPVRRGGKAIQGCRQGSRKVRSARLKPGDQPACIGGGLQS